jgi:hypothetical protein
MVYQAFQPKKFFLTLGILSVALSILGFFVSGIIPSASTANGDASPLVGGLIIAGCLGMAGFFFVRALDKKPQLRIDQNGIWYRAYSDATIPWDELVNCRLNRVYNQVIVGFDLRNPELYPSKNRFTRATAGFNRATSFGTMGIAATNLSGGAPGVVAAVRHYRPDLFEATSRVL